MAAAQEQGVIVFFSYARRDKMLRDRLEEHLSNLKYRGLIQTWHDRDILAGSDWLEQIDISLRNAQIILLLISSTFMASDYCYSKEMQQALQLHAQKKATVIPILLRPVLYAGAPFARLSMLPTNGKPVTSWRDRDSAFVDVALSIEKVAMYYAQNRMKRQQTASSQPESLPADSDGGIGAISGRTSCPYCGAEARTGDIFCLNCGNRLQPSTPSAQQADPSGGMSVPGSAGEWPLPNGGGIAPGSTANWIGADMKKVANAIIEPSTLQAEAAASLMTARDKIENPSHLVLQSDSGELLQDYSLDKYEMSIGRAPGSDILLAKDNLTSRRHATIHYENGEYVLRDERSANGTFVNGQQLEEMTSRTLHDGDCVSIGGHELIFHAYRPALPQADIESMPTMAVNATEVAEMTDRTREDELMTATNIDDFGISSMRGVEIPQPTTPPEDLNRPSDQWETIGNSDIWLPGEHAHLISDAIRRAYYTESLAAYERTLNDAPDNEEALRGLGKALYGLARYDEALEAFGRALQSRETPAAYAGLGDVLLKRKRYSEAVAAYEKAYELDQDATLNYPAFIHALREIGQPVEADRVYARGRDLGYFDDGQENMTAPATNPGDAP